LIFVYRYIELCESMNQECPDYLRELIRKTKTLTEKPFGIGVVLAFPHDLNIKTILEEKVAVLQLYWGDCSQELVDDAHFAGVKVIPQVTNFVCLPKGRNLSYIYCLVNF